MKIQQFGGGLATRLAPQFLNQDQGVVYTNVDNTNGELSPFNADTDTGILLEKHNTFYVKGQEWVSSATPTTYLEFQSVLYATDGAAATKRSDGVTNKLGIAAPEAAATTTSVNLADPIEELTVVNEVSVGDLPIKALAYRLYNTQGGVLSAPLEFIVEELAFADGVPLSAIASSVISELVNYYPTDIEGAAL